MSDKSLSINLGVSEVVKEVKGTKTGEAIESNIVISYSSYTRCFKSIRKMGSSKGI